MRHAARWLELCLEHRWGCEESCPPSFFILPFRACAPVACTPHVECIERGPDSKSESTMRICGEEERFTQCQGATYLDLELKCSCKAFAWVLS